MLALQKIDKAYRATFAVKSVSLEAAPGTVLGLVGENGAGKSTLIKIVSGAIRPDAGEIRLDGAVMAPRNTNEAIASGVTSVFQELTLLRSLSVEQNLFLIGAPVRPWLSVDRKRARRRAAQILESYELRFEPDRRVRDLSLGEQQMLEVVRAVERKPKVLLLDEATSALGGPEVEWLSGIVQRLRAQGAIVLFISHRWDEIIKFSNRAAVMRNGELISICDTADLTEDEAVRLMTGRAFSAVFPEKRQHSGQLVLRARSLSSPSLHNVDVDLHAGEILGLAGLVGQGQGALLRGLFGDERLKGGSIQRDAKTVTIARPRDAITNGIAYVPQERKTEGILLQKSVAFNMTLTILRRISSIFGLVSRRREAAIVDDGIRQLRIKAISGREPIRNLSGGNQQKVLLQKWLLRRPSVLLLNDVTRGVDIGTKLQIYNVISEAAREGVGVIWYSTDAMELVGMANRVLVMLDGRLNVDLQGDEVELSQIIRASLVRNQSALAHAR